LRTVRSLRVWMKFRQADASFNSRSPMAISNATRGDNCSVIEVFTRDLFSAGSSVFLLLLANIFPEYWYFSFIALTPLLYKLSRATPSESLRLGFLFGVTYFIILNLMEFSVSPLLTLIKITTGTLLFSLFGLITGWTRERWGFNPVLVALLWMTVELVLIKLGFINGVFQAAELTYPVFHGMATLFGFIFVSFAIVLLNSVLIWTVNNAVLVIFTSWIKTETRNQKYQLVHNATFFLQEVFSIPQERAPPCLSNC